MSTEKKALEARCETCKFRNLCSKALKLRMKPHRNMHEEGTPVKEYDVDA